MDTIDKRESINRKLINFSEGLYPILRDRAVECEEKREIS